MVNHTCEWCKTTYPDFDETVTYYELFLFGKEHHIVCNECIEHLKKVAKDKQKGTDGGSNGS